MDQQKVIKYLEKHYEDYPACKILEYKENAKHSFKRFYRTINSNRQISSLIELSRTKRGMTIYHRLLQLLSRKIYVQDYTTFLNKFINKDLTDDEVYSILKKYQRKPKYQKGGKSNKKNVILAARTYEECNKNTLRAQIYYDIISTYILKKDKKFKLDNYLDYGCGSCVITKVLGEALDLPYNKIFGADIPAWGEYTREERKKLPIKIIDLKENQKLPIKTSQFSLVTAFMVLHHVKNLELMLLELNRIIKKGGYLILREHDCINYADFMLADIEHMLFQKVVRDEPKAKENYYAKYYDWVEWGYMLDKHGFKCIHHEFLSDSVYFNLTPTRAFIGVYKKIK